MVSQHSTTTGTSIAKGSGRRGMVAAGAVVAAVLVAAAWQGRAHQTASPTDDARTTTTTSSAPAVASTGSTADGGGPVLYLVSSVESAQFLAEWTAQLGGAPAAVVVDTDTAGPRRQGFGEANTAQGAGQPAVQLVDLRAATS